MTYFQSILLGALQGATEFLPISSSGHLFLAEKYLKLNQNLNFEIALHFSSLLAILLYFRKEIWQLTKKLFELIFKLNFKTNPEGVYGLKLIFATLITFPVALIIKKLVFDSGNLTETLVASTLIITGIFIISAEKLRSFFKVYSFDKENLSFVLAFFLGIVQGLTVTPGISRSGMTIAFLILLGMNRKYAVKTSFFLAIPTILGAMIFSLNDQNWNFPITNTELFGCIISFFIALLSIKFMMKSIEKYWIWFAPYCFILGLILLIN